MNTKTRAGLAATLATVGILSACGSDGDVLSADGTHVLVGPTTNSGDDAGISGTVTMDGDCLGIGNGQVIIWPGGTTIVSEDPITIKVPGLGEIGLGDKIDGGGGMTDEPPDGVDVPSTCPSENLVVFRPQ